MLRMTTKVSNESIKQSAEIARKMLAELKNEMHVLTVEYNNIIFKQLEEENLKLTEAVKEAKEKLIQAEIANGVQQVPLPNTCPSKSTKQNNVDKKINNAVYKKTSGVDEASDNKSKTPQTLHANVSGDTESHDKVKKEKKSKPTKSKEPEPEAAVDVGRLDLRVAAVESVERHPDAATLYVLKINCGEERPRTVCSGLVKHIPIEDLRGIHVILLCNLKPAKMRGITSEAMVMCASTGDHVEVLVPPAGVVPGDSVECDGYTRRPDAVLNPKKKIFETVAPDLHTNDNLLACYKGIPLTVGDKGNVVAKTLKNVPIK